MQFGIPTQRRTTKEEKFPGTPVLTIGIDGGKGTSKSMYLNNTAVETLGLSKEGATIAFAFELSENKQDCVSVGITNGNHTAIPDHTRIKVTKGNPRKVSEKRTYEYLSSKAFALDNSIENHFELQASSINEEGAPVVFTLVPYGQTETKTESVEEETINASANDELISEAEPAQDIIAFEATSAI